VEMWITAMNERKHSLSTCGQTVYISALVIHIIQDHYEILKFT
jgi:hypothetical protein